MRGGVGKWVAEGGPLAVQPPKVERREGVVTEHTIVDATAKGGDNGSGASTTDVVSDHVEESVRTSEETSGKVASVSTNKPADGSATPAKEGKATSDGDVMHVSAPLAPMALAAVDAGQTVMAVQLFSGQVRRR